MSDPQDRTLSITTDVGMLVLYDPLRLKVRVKAPSSWWRNDPFGVEERRDGRLALWPLSSGRKAASRSYRVRLGGELSEEERPYVCGQAAPAPLVVTGEEVFLGPVERLPGDGSGDRLPAIPEQGRLLSLEPGRYAVTAHVLNWQAEERFWNEDNEPTADAPPDFVLTATPFGDAGLPAPPDEPRALLDLLPKKTPLASTKVRYATRPRSAPEEPPPRRGRRRRSEGGASARKAAPKERLPELRPGEMGVGATVRHPMHGEGTVLFVREGFPKARVNFRGREVKVEKDDLTVL